MWWRNSRLAWQERHVSMLLLDRHNLNIEVERGAAS